MRNAYGDACIVVTEVKDSVGGGFAVAGPDWERAWLPGVKVVRASTSMVFIVAMRDQGNHGKGRRTK